MPNYLSRRCYLSPSKGRRIDDTAPGSFDRRTVTQTAGESSPSPRGEKISEKSRERWRTDGRGTLDRRVAILRELFYARTKTGFLCARAERPSALLDGIKRREGFAPKVFLLPPFELTLLLRSPQSAAKPDVLIRAR